MSRRGAPERCRQDAKANPISEYLITTVTLAKGCAKHSRLAAGFFLQSPGKAGASKFRGEIIMNARKMLATAALCTLLAGVGFAQVTGQTIQERKNDQQGRIAQGVHSGQLTARETGNLERREASVNREQHAMRRADDGHLTARDKAALTSRQNHISRSIDKDKHNSRVR
jgi:hypothetical protein